MSWEDMRWGRGVHPKWGPAYLHWHVKFGRDLRSETLVYVRIEDPLHNRDRVMEEIELWLKNLRADHRFLFMEDEPLKRYVRALPPKFEATECLKTDCRPRPHPLWRMVTGWWRHGGLDDLV
jgi:hypothetical protein